MTQNTASLCPGANMHNATYIEYKTFYIEKNLQIVQNYPAAFSNAIQVLLTRSAILLHARSSVGNPQSWQPSPARPCLWAGSDARGCTEAHGNHSWGAGDSPALVCWPENRTKTTTRGYQRPAPACCFLCVTTWVGWTLGNSPTFLQPVIPPAGRLQPGFPGKLRILNLTTIASISRGEPQDGARISSPALTGGPS